MTPNVGQGYGLAAPLTIFERQSIPYGYRFSNNQQICCCNLIGEVITSPYKAG
jgi:hypothetical protein